MAHYLPMTRELWGSVPIRDPGLLASEGRITIPLEDDSPLGVLDIRGGFFEFLSADDWQKDQPETLEAHELQAGRRYVVVLTNRSGLVRYRLDDIVEMHGWRGQAPVLEFIRRAGSVVSMAGEKLTESQVVQAAKAACQQVGVASYEFIARPCWSDPPFYLFDIAGADVSIDRLSRAIDDSLCQQNKEYESRRTSLRLGPARVRRISHSSLDVMDKELMKKRGGRPEQFKRACLALDIVDGLSSTIIDETISHSIST
jgi:hypothetical protein